MKRTIVLNYKKRHTKTLQTNIGRALKYRIRTACDTSDVSTYMYINLKYHYSHSPEISTGSIVPNLNTAVNKVFGTNLWPRRSKTLDTTTTFGIANITPLYSIRILFGQLDNLNSFAVYLHLYIWYFHSYMERWFQKKCLDIIVLLKEIFNFNGKSKTVDSK